jgi:hypothetical protein
MSLDQVFAFEQEPAEAVTCVAHNRQVLARFRPLAESKQATNEKPGTKTGLLANMNKGKGAMKAFNQKLIATSVHF